nr:putative reverse transcriptase domain-containing protein [Tanacetum cinerariifolium]
EEAGVEPEAEGVDVELEAEEPDGVPEALLGLVPKDRLLYVIFLEAESGTSRTEIALLGSEAKIGKKMEREMLIMIRFVLAGGPGGASGSGGAGGSGGTGGNADGTGVRGTGPTVPELTGCTYATFIKCDPLPFNGTKGAVGLCQWFEKLESVFQISECK